MASTVKCKSCGKELHTNSFRRNRVLSISSHVGIMAIFANSDGSLDVSPAESLAVVRVKHYYYEGHNHLKPSPGCFYNIERKEGSDIVVLPMILMQGSLEVASEVLNFAGMCLAEEDPWLCLAHLRASDNEAFVKAAKLSGRWDKWSQS